MSENSKTLVIVESPAKAKKIGSFLGKDFRVLASMGHVRDLPAKAADIPAKYKKEPWSSLGVNVQNNFSPMYIIPNDKKKIVKELQDSLKGAKELILATDEDREGESIGWHLVQVLEPKVPVKRMVFSEITKEAIDKAIANPRQVDENLVNAQETRRVIDRLYGYTLSPLLWKKIARGLSAGRVQSVAVRILVERELERLSFRKGLYWDLSATIAKSEGTSFEAKLYSVDGQTIATGKDFDESTGALKKDSQVRLLNEETARSLESSLKNSAWMVSEVESREQKRYPYPPFITSTLQQESSRKLGFTARRTMQVAQKLYEDGFITYMRTDSVNLSQEAIGAARNAVIARYGKEYLHDEVRQFTSKSKNAQEAHEAIRPAGTQMQTGEDLGLSGDEAKLYALIWKRTMATQMADARLRFQTVSIKSQNCVFRASGKQILFPGFFRAYVEGSDEPESSLEDQEKLLPELKQNEVLKCQRLDPQGHETKPPARYTEASLVRKLEAEGIGRPSTYASIISTIQDRGYVRKQGQQLIPTFTAMAVTKLLETKFSRFVDLKFTAKMEETLDDIASGEVESLPYLTQFYSGPTGIADLVKVGEAEIDAREVCTLKLDGISSHIRVGRYGPYIERHGEDKEAEPTRASIPEDVAPGDITNEMIEGYIRQKLEGPKSLGTEPESGKPIFQMNGPFGPYLQVGQVVEGEDKPKRVGIPKNMPLSQISLEQALGLLSLPRRLGKHPETDRVVNAGIGRFGPYVNHAGIFKSLTTDYDVLSIDLETAVELLKTAKKQTAVILREMGAHPEDGKPVVICEGRYGPYLKHGRTNASLPKDSDVQGVTMASAMELLAKKTKGKKPTKGKKTAVVSASDDEGESQPVKKTKKPRKKAASAET